MLGEFSLWQTDILSQSRSDWMDFVMPGSGKETDTGARDDPSVWFGVPLLHASWKLKYAMASESSKIFE